MACKLKTSGFFYGILSVFMPVLGESSKKKKKSLSEVVHTDFEGY